VADGDYQPTNGTLTFQPGESSQTIPITIYGDGQIEFDETFSIELSNPIGATAIGTGQITILNDESQAAVRENFSTVDGVVYATLEVGGTLYIGGTFTHVVPPSGPPVTRNNIAAIDVVSGLPTAWDPDANGPVYALIEAGGPVYAGGAFSEIGGQPRDRIAAVDVSSGAATAWNPDADDAVRALAASGSVIYAGGNFGAIGGQNRNRIAALDVSTGLATAWNPNGDGEVRVIVPSGQLVYVGGAFANIGDQLRRTLVALDAGTGLATSWNPSPSYCPMNCHPAVIHDLIVSGSSVYIGGLFNFIGHTSVFAAAVIDANTGAATDWRAHVNDGEVRALALDDGLLYLGGAFSSAGGQFRDALAAVDAATGDGSPWLANVAPRFPGVHDITVASGRVYVGGEFTSIGGSSKRGIAVIAVPHLTDVTDETAGDLSFARLTPNPASGDVQLGFTLPAPAQVRISVYDIQGRLEARPIDDAFPVGVHRARWNAGSYRPGVYFVRFEVFGRQFIQRLALVR
jgi:hypothetical protein